MEVICFEHFQNYQYLKQSHLWKTLMIQVVSLALVFLKLVGFFTVHYRVNILQRFPRMNLVHCGLRNWGKSWIQRFLCLKLWLLIFLWSKMHFNKSSMRVPFKSNCLRDFLLRMIFQYSYQLFTQCCKKGDNDNFLIIVRFSLYICKKGDNDNFLIIVRFSLYICYTS